MVGVAVGVTSGMVPSGGVAALAAGVPGLVAMMGLLSTTSETLLADRRRASCVTRSRFGRSATGNGHLQMPWDWTGPALKIRDESNNCRYRFVTSATYLSPALICKDLFDGYLRPASRKIMRFSHTLLV